MSVFYRNTVTVTVTVRRSLVLSTVLRHLVGHLLRVARARARDQFCFFSLLIQLSYDIRSFGAWGNTESVRFTNEICHVHLFMVFPWSYACPGNSCKNLKFETLILIILVIVAVQVSYSKFDRQFSVGIIHSSDLCPGICEGVVPV